MDGPASPPTPIAELRQYLSRVERHGHGPDSREPKRLRIKPRDIYDPDLHIDTLKVKARNFR